MELFLFRVEHARVFLVELFLCHVERPPQPPAQPCVMQCGRPPPSKGQAKRGSTSRHAGRRAEEHSRNDRAEPTEAHGTWTTTRQQAGQGNAPARSGRARNDRARPQKDTERAGPHKRGPPPPPRRMLYNIAYARGVLQAAQRVNGRRALSLCSGRAAARHGCEHKTCYMICGGVVAAGARAQAPIASTARAARSGRRAGLGAKFRPTSNMARCRFGPFSPVLDGRFIAKNTFVLEHNKKGPCSVRSRSLQGPIFVLGTNVGRKYPAIITPLYFTYNVPG